MKNTCFIVLLLLGLGSCGKDEFVQNQKNVKETFTIKGENFVVGETTIKLAKILAIDHERLTFVKDSLGYSLDSNISHIIHLEPIIESIKNVKL